VREFLEEHLQRVYRFALRLTSDHHEAEDIVQETFLRAWRHRERLREPAAARFWLLRIAANIWRDQLRKPRRVALWGDAPEEGNGTGGLLGPPERRVLAEEEIERALRAMDALPERQRQVLYLHAFEELPHAEIAAVLEISQGAVKASLSLARRAMRERLRNLLKKD
jgi:RNA polymerase sigma-70 factor (ECF subfamily)